MLDAHAAQRRRLLRVLLILRPSVSAETARPRISTPLKQGYWLELMAGKKSTGTTQKIPRKHLTEVGAGGPKLEPAPRWDVVDALKVIASGMKPT